MAGVRSKRRIVHTATIIEELETERDRLDSALAALQESSNRRARGRTAGPTSINGRKRRMSAASKRRISDAMKKAWAARKKAA
jgi:exonuclease VII small subunit